MSTITQAKLQGSLLGLNATALVDEAVCNFTTNVTESAKGSFLLEKNGDAARRVITLSQMANPVMVFMESQHTVSAHFRNSGGVTVDQIRIDGVFVTQIPTNSAVVTIAVTHSGATTSGQFGYFVAGA